VLAGIESRVGRDGSMCSIALNEARVSGVHASLKLEGGILHVRDDKSHNGTFVNGNRIAPGTWIPVPGGSQLRFGPIEFVVRHES
jgi:pSer/pThr/pTyr-binding forkhead associated (FHA) protein